MDGCCWHEPKIENRRRRHQGNNFYLCRMAKTVKREKSTVLDGGVRPGVEPDPFEVLEQEPLTFYEMPVPDGFIAFDNWFRRLREMHGLSRVEFAELVRQEAGLDWTAARQATVEKPSFITRLDFPTLQRLMKAMGASFVVRFDPNELRRIRTVLRERKRTGQVSFFKRVTVKTERLKRVPAIRSWREKSKGYKYGKE